jgi:hypothetical protein
MGILSFSHYQKDTFIVPVKIEDSDGSPVDLTGAQIYFALGAYTHATSGVTITRDDTAGELTVTVHYSLMDALTPGEDYRFGIVIEWPGDIRNTVIDGWIALQGKVVD